MGLASRGIWGQVQGVTLIGLVNTRPMVCDTPSARSADARFIGEFSYKGIIMDPIQAVECYLRGRQTSNQGILFKLLIWQFF